MPSKLLQTIELKIIFTIPLLAISEVLLTKIEPNFKKFLFEKYSIFLLLFKLLLFSTIL
jgi:hypothetical protein